METTQIIKMLGRLLGYLERLDNEFVSPDFTGKAYELHIRECISKTVYLIHTYNQTLELRKQDDDKN